MILKIVSPTSDLQIATIVCHQHIMNH